MKLLKSLNEIRKYGHMLATLPTKTIRTIPEEEILNVYMAANKFVPEELQRYAQLYDLPNFKEVSVECLRYAAGSCSAENKIRIDFLHLLFANDITFQCTLLHELCHTKIHNHTVSFWELLDKKLKEASIINKNDNSRKKWLQTPALRNQDSYQLYDQPGKWYENISTIKSNIIRRKICLDSSSNGTYYLRIGYRLYSNMSLLLYKVNHKHNIHQDTSPSIPDEVRNILINILFNDNQLTTFDWADMNDFLNSGSVFEIYTGYGNGKTKVNAINEVIEKKQLTAIVHPYMALFVFYGKTSSSIPLDDIRKVSDNMYFTNIETRFVFCENSELNEDVFCVHLLLAGE